jgi:hypothetical protein
MYISSAYEVPFKGCTELMGANKLRDYRVCNLANSTLVIQVTALLFPRASVADVRAQTVEYALRVIGSSVHVCQPRPGRPRPFHRADCVLQMAEIDRIRKCGRAIRSWSATRAVNPARDIK